MGKNTTTTTVNIETNSVTDENKFKWWKLIITMLLMIGTLVGGYFWGKKTVKIEPQDPIYICGDTVKVEVPCPVPFMVKEPCDTMNVIMDCFKSGKYAEFFPERVKDSLIYIPTSEDTLAIIRDWATERYYEEKIVDSDTLGTAIIKAKTQYNRLSLLGADITPVIKEVPYIKEPKLISPFLGAGISTSPSVVIQGGIFIKDDWGASLMYQYDWQGNQNVWGLNLLYKF